MSHGVLHDLLTYKVPALKQAGLAVADDRIVLLFSKSGYDRQIHEVAARDPSVRLVDVAKALGG